MAHLCFFFLCTASICPDTLVSRRPLKRLSNRSKNEYKKKKVCINTCYCIYVTRFAKILLIAGEHNCSYSLFLSAKSIFVDFHFSSNFKNSSAIMHSYNSRRAL